MELGAVVCTKRPPACAECPVAGACAWRGRGADPADGSAGTSRPQAAFEGSDRQLRGRLVDRLREGPATRGDLAAITGSDDAARVAAVLSGLIADGLVEADDRRLWLAGDPQPGPVSEAMS